MKVRIKDTPIKAPVIGRRYFHVCDYCNEGNITCKVIHILDNAYDFEFTDGTVMYVYQEWLDDGHQTFYEIIEDKDKTWLSYQLIDMYKGEF